MKYYNIKKTIKIITIILKIYNITKLYFKKRLDSFPNICIAQKIVITIFIANDLA